MRRVRIIIATAFWSAVLSFSAWSQELPSVGATAAGFDRSTLAMPRPVRFAHRREALWGSHVRVVHASPAAPRRTSETQWNAPRTAGVLPGLPAALIAVVEGASAGARRINSVVGSGVDATSQPVAPAQPAAPIAGPVSLTATIRKDDDPSSGGLFLPFEAGVGAAAFTRADDLLVVFDAPRPLDLSGVLDSSIARGASVQLLPEATILNLAGHGRQGLTMRRLPGGWLIQTAGVGEAGTAIAPLMDGAVLRFPVQDPGRTVVVADPQTGGNLLVGTVRSGQEAVRVGRRSCGEIIEPTIQGVVIDPLSDRIELRPTAHAFLLSGTRSDMPAFSNPGSGTNAQIDVASPRVMSLRDRPIGALYQQLKAAKAAAAAAPVESRFLPRVVAAEDALALGDALQAETIIRVAVADDARDAALLRSQLILAAAQLLDHHPGPGDMLDDVRATSNSEIALWRAVKLAEQDPASPEAARLFAAGLSLLRSYPSPLQKTLMPLAEEALVRGGSDAQAAMIEHLPPGHETAFAHALLAERRGQTQSAVALLDHLASSQDISLADNAAEEAVAIRQATGKADPGKLAGILESHLLDSRIGGHELSTRMHLAELWVEAGQWQKALDLLRETASLFPEQQTDVRRRVGKVLRRLASAPAAPGGKTLDQAAMIEGNAEMLPDGEDGRVVSLYLADRLCALDLPERAAPVVQKMMRSTVPGADKAELGLRLADLDLQQNDLSGVQAALSESDASDLPPDLASRRLLVLARALAGAGQLDRALSGLASVNTPPALDFKASLLARRGEWGGATDMLLALARTEKGSAGNPDAAGQDLLLRLASAASRSRDKDRMERVRDLGRGRFADPGKAALFRLLISDPGADDAEPAKNSSETAALRRAPALVDAISD